LREKGIDVITYQQKAPGLPDSVFPNNWFSTHRNENIPNGLLCLYPMRVPTREGEKNPVIVAQISHAYQDFINQGRYHEKQCLEGTGSLIFDNANRKIYCELSERAHLPLMEEYMAKFNKISKKPYKEVLFRAHDDK
jgi:hypothetical protein